jgi:hypothetical protein
VAFKVPAAVGRLLTADVAAEIARTFGDQIVYPQRIVVDCPAGSSPAPPGFSRRFPGWPGPVLVLSDENQGVCSWGVPSGGGEVVVGGDLLDPGCATVAYAASVADFIAARRWDHRCLNTAPVLQAQAGELDQESLGYLRVRLAPAVATAGWPGSRQYRFEGSGVQVMLWSQAGQCDWWVSASTEHLCAGSPPACWTCPAWTRRCGPATKKASDCSAKCAVGRVSRAAAKGKHPREARRRPTPPRDYAPQQQPEREPPFGAHPLAFMMPSRSVRDRT